MTTRTVLWIVPALLVGLLVLAACGQTAEPVPVYVTPTPAQPTSTAQPPTLAPTASPSPLAAALLSTDTPAPPAPSPTALPGVTFGPIVASATPAPPAATSTPTTVAPGGPFGPIVGPGHTLVPTETRVAPIQPTLPIPTSVALLPPGAALRRDLLGVQIHPHIDSREFDRVMNHAQALGVRWVKYQFNWSALESAPGQFTELFYMLRWYVQRSHDEGFRVLISVAKAPGWSRTPDPDGVLREAGPPDDPQALANFLSGALQAIGRDASGAPFVSAIEVWNEPNLQREWHGQPLTGESYLRYFRPAYTAIRQFSPDITIVSAGPAPTGDAHWSANDRTWLQQLYDAGLAQYGTDIAVGIHPYGWANAPDDRCCHNPPRGWDDQPQFFFLDTVEAYRQIMVANGHGDARLWATELGWATFDGMRDSTGVRPPDPPDTPYFSFIDQWQQASYTLRALYLGQQRDYMGPMFVWNLNFATIPGAVDHSDPHTAYGMLDSRWQPRPVFALVQQAPKN
jgi:hypothetical protein